MLKRFIITAVLLGLGFGGVIGFKLFKQAQIQTYLQNMGTPPIYLNGAQASAAVWEQQLVTIGSLRAQRGIDIRSEVDGVIRAVHVEPGQLVKTGDLIVEIDDTVDRATLKSAKVRSEKARRDFQRDQALFERALISEDKFEASRSELESAQALVEEIQGTINKKTLRAPFASSVGIHNLAVGHYLGKGDKVVSLQALDTLYLDMQLPEKELERLHSGQQVVFSVPSHAGRSFPAQIRFIDVQVQATTRNVLVRAVVDNPKHELLPGMFASATIILNRSQDVVTLPRKAVAFSLYGETVYLLKQTRNKETGDSTWTAHRQPVKSGEVRNGRVSIEGIEPGQVVALDTQHRLLEGSPVVIENLASLTLQAQVPVAPATHPPAAETN